MKNEISSVSNVFQADPVKPFKKPRVLKRQWVVFSCFSACFIMFLLRYNLRWVVFWFLKFSHHMMINYMMSHHWWPITYRLLFSLKSVAIVAITEEKVICGPSSTVSSLNSTDSSTTISSSISTFDHNSTGSDDVTCYEYKYKFSEVMTSQFLAAYFYGKYKFI